MIELQKISKTYGTQNVLSEISLTLEKGKITGLVGPNGCGKTTLIKSVLGLVIPDGGKILVDGEDIDGKYMYRQNIGYLPQNPDFPANLSVKELFDMLMDVREQTSKSLGQLTQIFQLEDQMGKTFSSLSGGTKQKVAAVTAFMFDSPFLILDEPTVGLDPVTSQRLKTLTRDRAKAGAGVLLVSHIMSEMDQLVDQMTFVLDGKVQYSGSVSDLKSKTKTDNLEQAVVAVMNGGNRE